MAACHNPTLPSKTIIIPPPTIACPAPPSPVTASNGQTATVTYGVPTTTGGTSPLTVVCTPPSGSAFAIGSTPVSCTATDAVRRAATCVFAVSVVRPEPRLTVRTILAFGDSITEGEVPVPGEFGTFGFHPQYVQLADSYPAALVKLLASRYPSQSATLVNSLTLFANNTTDCWTNTPAPVTSGIVVINAGCLGEPAQGTDTLKRLNEKMTVYRPDLVLILAGTNDLVPGHPESIAKGVQGLQTLIGAVRNRGTAVMVGTLLPQIAGKKNAGSADLVVSFNSQLKPAAISSGARVVDLYSDIVTQVTTWISPYDGLHPTTAGYAEMARVWFNDIRSAYEVQ